MRIAEASTHLATAQVQQQAQTAMLRKSLDAEQQAALQLLQSLPEPHLGKNVDITV